MINLIIWFASFLCPNPTPAAGNSGSSNTIQTDGNPVYGNDTGGETGGGPRIPPPPPPPPGG